MIKPYKFQASVTLLPQPGVTRPPVLPAPACRVVVRAAQPGTAGSRLFSALITPGQDTVPGDEWHTVLTVTVLGDGADECLAAGRDFTLWRGGDVGRGVVTRRVFV